MAAFTGSVVNVAASDDSPLEASMRAAVADAMRARAQRELADLELRRSIVRLGDAGMSQRRIAELVDISQPEVSRRLRRRELVAMEVTPREVILRRQAGLIGTRAMMNELSRMTMTTTPPSPAAAYDGSASTRGTAKQLTRSFQEGMLTKAEYEKLRKSIHLAGQPSAA